MHSLEVAFEVDEPAVIYEESDGEIVLVDLRNGKYYRLQGESSLVFTLVTSGHPMQRIVARCEETHAVADELRAVVEDLHERQLIRERPASITEELAPWVFKEFQLEVFEDLQEILKLDPIHESDPELGWPTARN